MLYRVEISSRLRRRYPSLSSLARCGLVSGGEVARLGPEAAWWRPLVWSAELLTEKEDLYRYGKGGRALLQQTSNSLHISVVWHLYFANKMSCLVPSTRPPQHHLLLQLSEWRRGLADVAAYSAAPVPLVYTQVAATRVTCHV